MSKLNDNECNFVRLLLRSPDMGDGWRKVSETVRPLAVAATPTELFEMKEDDGLKIRLTPVGQNVADYLL